MRSEATISYEPKEAATLRRSFVAIGVSVMVLGGVLPAQADDKGNKKEHQAILNAITGGSPGGGVKMNPNTGEFRGQARGEWNTEILLVELAR